MLKRYSISSTVHVRFSSPNSVASSFFASYFFLGGAVITLSSASLFNSLDVTCFAFDRHLLANTSSTGEIKFFYCISRFQGEVVGRRHGCCTLLWQTLLFNWPFSTDHSTDYFLNIFLAITLFSICTKPRPFFLFANPSSYFQFRAKYSGRYYLHFIIIPSYYFRYHLTCSWSPCVFFFESFPSFGVMLTLISARIGFLWPYSVLSR